MTDRHRLASGDDPARCDRVIEQVGRAAQAGVDLVQVREGDLDDRALLALMERCLAAVAGKRTRVVVNDRLDLAVAARAHGVHLKSGSIPGDRARRLAPEGFLIGRSVHSVEEAERAAAGGGLDYLILGTIFESRSKPGVRPLGLETLGRAVTSVRMPVLAIGGVTASNAADVARRGAAGIAGIGLFDVGGTASVREIVRDVRQAFEAPP